jgi:hypothetical protein
LDFLGNFEWNLVKIQVNSEVDNLRGFFVEIPGEFFVLNFPEKFEGLRGSVHKLSIFYDSQDLPPIFLNFQFFWWDFRTPPKNPNNFWTLPNNQVKLFIRKNGGKSTIHNKRFISKFVFKFSAKIRDKLNGNKR